MDNGLDLLSLTEDLIDLKAQLNAPSKFDFMIMRSFEPTVLHHGRRFELGPFLYDFGSEIRPRSDISTEIQIRERYQISDMAWPKSPSMRSLVS
jgi:hypothetical protein